MHMHMHTYMYTHTHTHTRTHRGKIQELSQEVLKMTSEIEAYNKENTTYHTFEKR